MKYPVPNKLVFRLDLRKKPNPQHGNIFVLVKR